MKRELILFVLRDKTSNKIYAISDDETIMREYIQQFYEYFKDNYEISRINNEKVFNDAMMKYCYLNLHYHGGNKLILTEFEWGYYYPQLREMYDRTKDTIVGMNLTTMLFNHKGIDLKKQAEELYKISSSLDSFIANLSDTTLNSIIQSPILAHVFNSDIEAMKEDYLYKLNKED